MTTEFTPNLTFRGIGMTPNDPSAAADNLDALNLALFRQAGLDLTFEGGTRPIYGLGETYFIAKGDNPAIILRSNNHVVCLPGCKLVRPQTFDSGNVGVLSGGNSGDRISNARWIGAEFIGLANSTTGAYPPGTVIRIIGDDVWIEDVIVNGFGAIDGEENRGGIAMALSGDRITLVRPRVVNPFATNAAGIRVYRGRGFRCYGGEVASGGDAALQLSTGSLAGAANDGIFDAAYIGTQCSSVDGRLMLVGTSDTPILGGRFERIRGIATGDGECIRVQNNSGNDPDHPQSGGSIAELDFLDVAVGHGSTAAPAVVIVNDFDEADKRVAAIRFGNLWVDTPSDIAFLTYSKTTVHENEAGPIQDLSWIGGGVRNPTNTKAPALSLERLNRGVFARLQLPGGINRPTVLLGDTVDGEGEAYCRAAAFEDVVVGGVKESRLGVCADKAIACSWNRGAVSEADPLHPAKAAFQLTANVVGFTIVGADTSGITTAYKIDDGATYAIRDGFGDRRATATQLGAAVPAQVTVTAMFAPISSSAELNATAALPLTTVNGSDAGTLLALVPAASSASVTATDDTGNLRLAGNLPFTGDDALLLLRRGSNLWLELSRAVS